MHTYHDLLAHLPVQPEVTHIAHIAENLEHEGIGLAHINHLPTMYPGIWAMLEELSWLTSFFNPVELYTIDDVHKVKEEFLAEEKKGREYNPTFSYNNSLEKIYKKLDSSHISFSYIERRLYTMLRSLYHLPKQRSAFYTLLITILEQKILDDLSTIELIHGLEEKNDQIVRSALRNKYGGHISKEMIEAAHEVLAFMRLHPPRHALPEEVTSIMLTPEDFKEAVEWMLQAYYKHYENSFQKSFPEEMKYRVSLSEHCSSIDVRDKSSQGPEIVIPYRHNDLAKFMLLLRHEIDAHVRNSLNGYFLFTVGGGQFKFDDEVWYEGLAMFKETTMVEDLFGIKTRVPAPYHTFSIHYAEQGKSFYEVFQSLKELMLSLGHEEEEARAIAWSSTYRSLRGHIHTENKEAYALPKDLAYLRGWILQGQLSARGMGHLAAAAILPVSELHHLVRFGLHEQSLPFPDINVAYRYLKEVLLHKHPEAFEHIRLDNL